MANKIQKTSYPTLVARVSDKYTLVINRGSEHGVTKGDHFLVYSVDPEELTDPETGKSLGNLEIIRGTGTATHVQLKMTTIKSNRVVSKGRIIRRQRGVLASLSGEVVEEPEKEVMPFDDPSVGDKVKLV